MENQEVYNLKDGSITTIIHKHALDEKAPEKINIQGTIESVSIFLRKRTREIDEENPWSNNMVLQTESHILVDREKMKIHLVFNEMDSLYKSSVEGKLEHSNDYSKWEINEGHEWGHEKFAEFCKMNRSFFTSPAEAMRLFSELKNIKIKADNAYENENDNRGSNRILIAQKIISSNIPDKFRLKLPIFKGQPKQEFEVEIYVNPTSYAITLISPSINDYITEHRDCIIDEEIKKIEDVSPMIPIIEQ